MAETVALVILRDKLMKFRSWEADGGSKKFSHSSGEMIVTYDSLTYV
jgi:hypothetical protein